MHKRKWVGKCVRYYEGRRRLSSLHRIRYNRNHDWDQKILGILGSTIGKKKSYNGKRDLGQDRYWSKVRIRHREASSQLAGEIYLQLGLSILLIVVTLEDVVVVFSLLTHFDKRICFAAAEE